MEKSTVISHLKSASRELFRQLEFLHDKFSTIESLSQCHILLELDVYKSVTMGQLSTLLNLDNSTTTRLIAPLLEKNLCKIQPDQNDRRNKLISLTPQGEELVGKANEGMHAHLEQVLAMVHENERELVTKGVATYAQALKNFRIKNECIVRKLSKKDIPQLFSFLDMIRQELNYQKEHPHFHIVESELKEICATYMLPKNQYFILEHDKNIMGGGGYGPADISSDICVVRGLRMPIKIRGLGLGTQLLEKILLQAQIDGFQQCYLEIYDCQQSSRAFYKRLGFQELDKPFIQSKHDLTNRWFIKDL